MIQWDCVASHAWCLSRCCAIAPIPYKNLLMLDLLDFFLCYMRVRRGGSLIDRIVDWLVCYIFTMPCRNHEMKRTLTCNTSVAHNNDRLTDFSFLPVIARILSFRLSHCCHFIYTFTLLLYFYWKKWQLASSIRIVYTHSNISIHIQSKHNLNPIQNNWKFNSNPIIIQFNAIQNSIESNPNPNSIIIQFNPIQKSNRVQSKPNPNPNPIEIQIQSNPHSIHMQSKYNPKPIHIQSKSKYNLIQNESKSNSFSIQINQNTIKIQSNTI